MVILSNMSLLKSIIRSVIRGFIWIFFRLALLLLIKAYFDNN